MEKKIFVAMLVAVMAFANSNLAFSQEVTAGPSDNVTLNIRLNPIQTLLVTDGQKTVDLVYTTRENYQLGVTQRKDNHLTIYSTGGYEISAKTSGETFTGKITGPEVGTVTITPEDGSENPAGGDYYALALSTSPQILAENSKGGVDAKISVTYKGAGLQKYLNFYQKEGLPPVVYTTQVTYTIVSK